MFFKLIIHYSGLFALRTTKLEPKSCSQRMCDYKEALLFSTWISSKVSESGVCKFLFFNSILFQVLSGCDCCVLDGQLMPDGHSWVQDGKVYGKVQRFS